MKHSDEITQAIAAFFEKSGWDYEYEEKWNAFFAKRSVPNAAGRVYLTVVVYEDKYIVFARILDFCEEENRKELALLFSAINHKIAFGRFEFDFSDGDMQYRYAVDCTGMTPSQEIVKHSVVLPFLLMSTYGDAICAVMNGECTAKEALTQGCP